MGTRNLTMVVKDKKPVIAQYGQWDGYPSGQGLTVLEFLKKRDMKRFEEKLKLVHFVTEEEAEEMKQTIIEITGNDSGWMTSEEAAKYNSKYPYVSRDIAAEILDMVYKSNKPMMLRDSSSFAGDSLFCEWAYVIDMDKKVLEVYEGFNGRPLGRGQRFKDAPKTDSGYEPIRCKKKYKFSQLPTKRQFIKELERNNE